MPEGSSVLGEIPQNTHRNKKGSCFYSLSIQAWEHLLIRIKVGLMNYVITNFETNHNSRMLDLSYKNKFQITRTHPWMDVNRRKIISDISHWFVVDECL